MRHWPLPFLLISLMASPALAQEATWQETVEAIADQLAHMPRSVALRTLAIQDIRDEQTQVRWPLSDQLERALSEALAKQGTPYQVLNQGVTGELGPGEDGILTGSFTQDPVSKRYRISLLVRNLKNQETLYTLAPVGVLADALLAGATPSVGFGRLIISTDVPGAQVFLDGYPAGKGAMVKSLPLGSHVVTVAAEGYEVFEAPVTLRADAPAVINARLARQSVVARFEGPAGAALKLDGADRGVLPLGLEDLAAGKHHLVATKNGYKAFERDFDWDPARPQPLVIALELLPGNLVVSSDAPGAALSMDGIFVGKAPRLITGLSAGHHHLKLDAPGYSSYEQDVAVRSAQTANVRVRMVASVPLNDGRSEAIALVARTGSREERALLVEVADHLAKHHPQVRLVPVDLAARTVDRLMPDGLREDSAGLRTLAAALAARQIVVLGNLGYAPFARLAGLWPQRPTLQASLTTYRSIGSMSSEPRAFVAEGGEPWGLGSDAPGWVQLHEALVPELSDAIAGESSPQPAPSGPLLDHEGFVLAGVNRLNLGLGLDYRPIPFLDLGLNGWYFNALGADRTDGTKLSGTNGGAALVYGVGQAFRGRLDASFRFDGAPAARGPFFDGARWTPYLGVGYRLDVNRDEVYAVGRKDSEGGTWQLVHRGVAIAGAKVYASGTVWRAEAEVPVVYSVWDTPDLRLTLGAGWVW